MLILTIIHISKSPHYSFLNILSRCFLPHSRIGTITSSSVLPYSDKLFHSLTYGNQCGLASWSVIGAEFAKYGKTDNLIHQASHLKRKAVTSTIIDN
jgi:hypothetical protein